ncbi:MAG: HDOD domain-containing protein [Rhodocyclaceae bacterium]|nr:HDOD domain-containing protein [Rhodocyclaceae bacterium]
MPQIPPLPPTIVDARFSDLGGWLEFYRQADLPVLRHTAHELERLRETAENVNGRALSAIILRDPLMTLRVLGFIEKNRGKRQDTDITTIERALMMIGIGPFFNAFQDLPLVEDRLKGHPKALLGLLKVIARARKAAFWARDWAALRHDLSTDEVIVATLLHDYAEILMWCFAPALATQVKDRQTQDRTLRSVAIQAEVYGIPLYELKLALAEEWHLPELLTSLMDAENAAQPRVRNVKLAVDLARHSANGWDDAALPDDYTAIADLLRVNEPTIKKRIGVPEPQPEPDAAAAADASRSSAD